MCRSESPTPDVTRFECHQYPQFSRSGDGRVRCLVKVKRHDDSYEYLGQASCKFCLGKHTCVRPLRKTVVGGSARFCCTFRGDLFIGSF